MTTSTRSYSRQRLIESQQLIPAADGLAAEFGLTCPVAYSLAAWRDSVAWPNGYAPRGLIDPESRREWYLLLSLHYAIHQTFEEGARPPARLDFEHYRIPAERDIVDPRRTRLVAECGPGDDGERVVTVMLPGQRVPWI